MSILNNIPIKTCLINNFGDKPLNVFLYNKITGLEPNLIDIKNTTEKEQFLFSGSVLRYSNKNSIIWGSGFISKYSRFIEQPKHIHAVRGILSKNIIIKSGIKCSDIIGDPGLLLPRLYPKGKNIKYDLGIIPHYSEKTLKSLDKYRENGTIKIVDITKPVEEVIDSILECKHIASSSLHGVILADAYRISNVWIKLSNFITGDDFKYKDYFSSINRETITPLDIQSETSKEEIINNSKIYQLNINLDDLWNCCPMRNIQ